MRPKELFQKMLALVTGVQAGTTKQETIADLYGNQAPAGKLSEIRAGRRAFKAEQLQRSQRNGYGGPSIAALRDVEAPTHHLPKVAKRRGRWKPLIGGKPWQRDSAVWKR